MVDNNICIFTIIDCSFENKGGRKINDTTIWRSIHWIYVKQRSILSFHILWLRYFYFFCVCVCVCFDVFFCVLCLCVFFACVSMFSLFVCMYVCVCFIETLVGCNCHVCLQKYVCVCFCMGWMCFMFAKNK